MGVRIETLADGHVSEIHVGLKGTMAALFLKDLAQKTRRGQMGRVKAGRIPGGRSYGYDVVPSGEDRGRRIINEREAAIVRRIYEQYAAGIGTLAIVRAVNGEAEPGPSRRHWNVSALIGSPKRRNGLLNNELYRGTIVYNRQWFLKDPATGKRVSRANPESEWLRQDVPEFRIVDDELWHRVQRLRESKGGSRPHEKRRPQRLLSGLIYCGCCGAKFNIATRDFMRCSARTNSGTCQESRLIEMTEVEGRVLKSLERHLLTPEMVDAAVEAYEQEIKQSGGAADGVRERLRSELASVEAKLERMLRLVEDGHAHPAVAGPRLNELSAKKKQLAADLAVSPASEPIVMVSDGGAGYRAMVGDLRAQLCEQRETAGEAVSLVRGLIRRITVSPQTQRERQEIEIEAVFSPVHVSTERYCTGGCGGQIKLLQSWPRIKFPA